MSDFRSCQHVNMSTETGCASKTLGRSGEVVV